MLQGNGSEKMPNLTSALSLLLCLALYCPNQLRQGQGSLLWSMPVSFLRKRAGRRRVENGSGGENEDISAHVCLIYFVWKTESEVAQSCPTLFDPMGCSLPGSSIQGSNLGLLHCRQTLYKSEPPGKPRVLTLCKNSYYLHFADEKIEV